MLLVPQRTSDLRGTPPSLKLCFVFVLAEGDGASLRGSDPQSDRQTDDLMDCLLIRPSAFN